MTVDQAQQLGRLTYVHEVMQGFPSGKACDRQRDMPRQLTG